MSKKPKMEIIEDERCMESEQYLQLSGELNHELDEVGGEIGSLFAVVVETDGEEESRLKMAGAILIDEEIFCQRCKDKNTMDKINMLEEMLMNIGDIIMSFSFLEEATKNLKKKYESL